MNLENKEITIEKMKKLKIIKGAIKRTYLIDLYFYINKIKKLLGIVSKREPFVIGKTDLPMNTCYELLITLGYQWDYFAWEDIGEGISVRKLFSDCQTHVRIFKDGEIRAHDEYNYEFEPKRHYDSVILRYIDHGEKLRILKVLSRRDD